MAEGIGHREVTVNIVGAGDLSFEWLSPDPRTNVPQRVGRDPDPFQTRVESYLCIHWARNELEEGDLLYLELDGVRVGRAEMISEAGAPARLSLTVASSPMKTTSLEAKLVAKFR